MKFRKVAPAVLIAAVVVTIATVSIVSNLISHRMAASFEKGQFELIGRIVQSKLIDAEGKAIAAAEIIAAMPEVKKAFAARNRDELLGATREAYRVQREKYGISQAQFHLAPAVSFLRVHNPPVFGEDLSHYRKIVAEVNQSSAIRKGVEVTTSGLGIFGTLPMTDGAGKATGSFEVALEFGPLLDELKKTYGFELALFIDEKTLRETATSLKEREIFSEQNRLGPYVTFRSTHPELMRALVADADVAIPEESHYIRKANDLPYGVLLQPIYNYAKKQIGVMAIARDFSATRSADGQAAIWQTLTGLLAIVLLAGVIIIVIRGMLLRPMTVLGNRVAALADGVQSHEVPAPESSCEEMRELASHCERLAQRATNAAAQDRGAS